MAAPLRSHFPFAPTSSQDAALQSLDAFLADEDQDVFVLRGAAGTGKTALMRALSDGLHARRKGFHLAAPTGRAARVLRRATGRRATTVHSLLYTPEPLKDEPGVRMKRRANLAEGAVCYVVDEASMVSDVHDTSPSFQTPASLLTDLVDYVKRGPRGSKLVFIGDPCQLPPVSSDFSPALDCGYLEGTFGLTGAEAELTQVKRQQAGSPVLQRALRVRAAMQQDTRPHLDLPRVRDLVGGFMNAYDPERPEAAALLAWTNRDVNRLNDAVREHLGHAPAPLMPGDRVLTQRPHYHPMGSVLGGEPGIVVATGRTEQVAGLTFLEATVQFLGEDDEPFEVHARVNVDVLQSERGRLRSGREKALFAHALRTNEAFRERRQAWEDPYVGALRLRYGYALTVHKAQGSEWDQVFLHPYMCGDLRWQYTALTRARRVVHTGPRRVRLRRRQRT